MGRARWSREAATPLFPVHLLALPLRHLYLNVALNPIHTVIKPCASSGVVLVARWCACVGELGMNLLTP